MENLVFSLNATSPIFALMVLGYLFRKIGLIDEKAAGWMNKFVFKVALPVLVFKDLASQDFAGTWNGKFVLFCFLVTSVSIAVIALFSKVVVKDKGKRGEFIQSSYRSSAALLGIAFIHNIYGDAASGMGPLMILGSVPLYNIFAVIVLMLTAETPTKAEAGTPSKQNSNSPGEPSRANNVSQAEMPAQDQGALLKKTLYGIVTNPIIIGIAIGLIWSLIRIPQPKIFQTIVSNVAALATPLGLMSMGATFEFKKAIGDIKPALVAAFIKLFALAAIFLPIAVALGFKGEQIVAILVMLGSATTVSCYIMAKSMGHEGTLSSSVIMLTTFGCSFSLTLWLFVLRSLGVI
ncbi:MAG: AEC family transporter [Lachnospiraceae bacterium]|nr:AEC family transporter [Lachnospiraceae bacterium]MBR4607077.1 AEC family transporter [Lachnospiraceae bacterium]